MTQDLRPIPYNGYQRTARNTDTTGWYFKEEHTIAISGNETVYIPFREEHAIAIRNNTSTKTKTQDQKGQTEHREELTTKIPTKDLRPITYNQYQRRARNLNTIEEHAIAIRDNTSTKTKTQDQKDQTEHREELTTKIPIKDVSPITYNQYQRRARNLNTIEEHAIAIRNNTSTKTKTQDQKGQTKHREELTTKIPIKDVSPITYNQYQRRARNLNTIEEHAIPIKDNTPTKTKTQDQKDKTKHREELTTKIPIKDVSPITYNQYQRRARNLNTIEEHAIPIRDNTSRKIPRKDQRKEELTNESGLAFQSYRSKKKVNKGNRNDQSK
ncbi:MAG: hypothetical protein MGG11_20480 [Trichodesmium sp. MAG_R03]|nr:hypothetical protein [Trichodesmium sp. MAG_R03]